MQYKKYKVNRKQWPGNSLLLWCSRTKWYHMRIVTLLVLKQGDLPFSSGCPLPSRNIVLSGIQYTTKSTVDSQCKAWTNLLRLCQSKFVWEGTLCPGSFLVHLADPLYLSRGGPVPPQEEKEKQPSLNLQRMFWWVSGKPRWAHIPAGSVCGTSWASSTRSQGCGTDPAGDPASPSSGLSRPCGTKGRRENPARTSRASKISPAAQWGCVKSDNAHQSSWDSLLSPWVCFISPASDVCTLRDHVRFFAVYRTELKIFRVWLISS